MRLMWFYRKPSSDPVANRAARRALTRMSRPQRHIIEALTRRLRRLPVRERVEVLDRLPAWQRAYFEEQL
jgi:hypothetical protein